MPGPCCMFKSKLRVHVHAACPYLYCNSMSVSKLHVHAEWPCPWCISMSILQSMSMLHVHVYAASQCPCCMSISMLHVDFYALCLCPRCMSLSVLYVYIHAACPRSRTSFKGTVSRDFLTLFFFFIKQLLLNPLDTPRKDWTFFRIFEEHQRGVRIPGVFIHHCGVNLNQFTQEPAGFLHHEVETSLCSLVYYLWQKRGRRVFSKEVPYLTALTHFQRQRKTLTSFRIDPSCVCWIDVFVKLAELFFTYWPENNFWPRQHCRGRRVDGVEFTDKCRENLPLWEFRTTET